jgi:hypothetical protein
MVPAGSFIQKGTGFSEPTTEPSMIVMVRGKWNSLTQSHDDNKIELRAVKN